MKAKKAIIPKGDLKGFDPRGDAVFALEITTPFTFIPDSEDNKITFVAPNDFPDHPFVESIIDEIVDRINKMECIKNCL